LRILLIIVSIFFCQVVSANLSSTPYSFNYDLQLKSGKIEFLKNNSFNIEASIYNSGLKTAKNFNLIIFIDNNNDSVYNEKYDNLIYKKDFDSLSSKDSLSMNITYEFTGRKTKQIVFYINYKDDMKPDNNITVLYFSNPYPQRSITINEIMFNPLNNYPEYIELYNNTNDTINLFYWKLADQYLSSGKRNELVITKSCDILPLSYLTLTADSSIVLQFPYLTLEKNLYYSLNKSSLNLNNDVDDVVLIDLNGITQDSLRYSENWHNPNVSEKKGISLEKKSVSGLTNDKNNWTSSAALSGGTPSKPNSIISNTKQNSESITASPNPFSPDGDGYEDFTIFTYSTNAGYSNMRVRIFDKTGRLQRTIINNNYSSGNGSIQWDGFDDNGKRLKTGIYIVFLELLNEAQGKVKTFKLPVVIAKKL
jgi:hypothetical protein